MFVNNATIASLAPFPFQRTVTLLAITAALSGCSVLKEDKIDYKSAVKASTLEIPPDLSQLRRESRFAFESTSATAAGFQNASTRVADAIERIQTVIRSGPKELLLCNGIRTPDGGIQIQSVSSGELSLKTLPDRLQPVIAGWLTNASEPQRP